ncbi:hypothetical protein, partial [Companilactobacillus furfuricola]|uniref:hypothetical protein n=1 Tax=Companilactobacillus furfuricola TaxID=1462575 RepID=UPI001B86946A
TKNGRKPKIGFRPFFIVQRTLMSHSLFFVGNEFQVTVASGLKTVRKTDSQMQDSASHFV